MYRFCTLSFLVRGNSDYLQIVEFEEFRRSLSGGEASPYEFGRHPAGVHQAWVHDQSLGVGKRIDGSWIESGRSNPSLTIWPVYVAAWSEHRVWKGRGIGRLFGRFGRWIRSAANRMETAEEDVIFTDRGRGCRSPGCHNKKMDFRRQS